MGSNLLKQLFDSFRESDYSSAKVTFSETEQPECLDMVQISDQSYGLANQAYPLGNQVNKPIYWQSFSTNIPSGYDGVPVSKNIDEFKVFVTPYNSPKGELKKVKKLLTKELSKLLKYMCGNQNTSNTQRIDSVQDKLNFIAGYLERVAYDYALLGENKVLRGFLSALTESGRICYRLLNSQFDWKIGYSGRQGTGFVKLVQDVFTLSYADAVATAARILGLNIHYFFNVYTRIDRKADKEYVVTPMNEVLPSFWVTAQDGTNKVAQLVNKVPIYGFSKQQIGAIAIYSLGTKQFCLPASVANGKLNIGKHQANAYLLNQDVIDANPSATIILCYDMKTAIAFDEIIKGLAVDISHQYIVTAHLGENCSVVPWSYCLGRNVIYVGAPCEESFEVIEEYEKFIISADAESFCVYPHLILRVRNDNAYRLDDLEKLTEGERLLFENATYLPEVEHVSIFLEHIVKNSLTYQEYVAFWQNKGLFHIKDKNTTLNRASKTLLYSSFQLDTALSDKSLPTHDVLPSIGLATLRGPKNGGKSYVVLSFIIWMMTGSGFITDLRRCEGRRVLLIDSETVPFLLSKRIQQMKLAEYFGDSLHVISKEDPSENNLWKLLDLSNKEDRERIKRYAQENNINYIFFDNLTSLVGDGQMYVPKAMGQIYSWAEELRKDGIGTCLVNHNCEDKGQSTLFGKARGSHEFSIRSHTEIVIIGTDEILSNNDWPQVVKDSVNKRGITLGLCFKTCKMAAILERKVFWLHLPYDASEWEQILVTDFEGQIIEDVLPDNLEIDSVEAVLPVVDEKVDTPIDTSISQLSAPLSKNAEMILSYLDTQGITKFKKETITEALQITDAQFRIATNSLREYGLIELIGNGPASYYLRKK